ncbi:hypothetical protein PIB30_042185 [Stylosanthes scabra]|uniref:Uncharacterized protein n=1 Tax=Stylosanthes scabra TaxID=79078 RepID=A0ABU6TES6_9FABA|nr:hypothetical protein [Stylosanthes scabra]
MGLGGHHRRQCRRGWAWHWLAFLVPVPRGQACRYKHHVGVTSSFPVQPRRQIHVDPESRVSLPAAAARRKTDAAARHGFLVDVGRIPAGQPVAATPVRIAEPPAPKTKAAMGHSEEGDLDYATSTASSSDTQEGGDGGAKTRLTSCPRYILPASPPIPRVEDVPCFFQQLDLDGGACSDPLNAGLGNDYNTDRGQRSESAIGCATGKRSRLQ